MCGLSGVFAMQGYLNNTDKQEVRNAATLIKHRGPDNIGIWSDDEFCISHNKLSISDFSSNSNQPVTYKNVVVAFNGEIYNYEVLKKEFDLPENYIDVHVIASLYNILGMKFLERIEGDFAITLYDKKLKKLFLIRDRLGVKPLVYYSSSGRIYFSSEVKSFMAFSRIKLLPNFDKIFTDLLMWFWADKKETYFKNIFHVKAGEYLEIDSLNIKTIKYWDISFDKYKDVKLNDLEDALKSSTYSRMNGEAKLATLLSGGLDSSLLNAIIAKKNNPISSYTVEYDKGENNTDLYYADLVAKKYPCIVRNINHISKKEITIDTIDTVTYFLEEVVWDKVYYSMYKNYLKAHNDGFRVVINGQGSDEIFLGYYHDFPHYKFNEKQLTSSYLTNYFVEQNIHNIDIISNRFNDINKLTRIVDSNIKDNLLEIKSEDKLNRIAFWATKTYLQSNLLQEDKMSMASSVECRTPFTNYKLIELAFSLAGSAKVCNDIEKYPIKKIGGKYLPTEIANRRKQAFVNPSFLYNDEIVYFLRKKCEEMRNSEAMRNIFSDCLFDQINTDLNKLDAELIWKIVAIYRFFVRFKFE